MSRCRGFTLMEALAMLLLIGIVIPTVLGAVSVATRTASVTGSRVQATLLAEAKLDEIIATRSWQQGDAEGDFAVTASGEPLHDSPLGGGQAAGGHYHWQLLVDEAFDLMLMEVRVRVMWQQQGHVYAVELATLVREEGV